MSYIAMETLKLVAATFGLLIIIVGFFFVAFSLLGRKNTQNDDSCSTNNSQSFGCGCGTRACGLPYKEKN
ncbi:MAG: hypothetical protein ACLFNU_12920 [Bacteroidales bacterium]